jgi:hypothetical protein
MVFDIVMSGIICKQEWSSFPFSNVSVAAVDVYFTQLFR